ncbi:MAG TPA: hypothetical protein VK845_16755 [Gemmatimonadales bacterium]|nr:hypothetical protein [Gemmatimonadales bacterium]
MSLHYFPVPPDITADTSDLGKMWEFARSRRASTRAVQISLETIDIQGCRLVRQIVKVPQEPSGMTYIGSVTAPFRDFSFVLKIEAKEEGMTGIRDNVVFGEMLRAGRVDIDPEAKVIRGWTQDPLGWYQAGLGTPVWLHPGGRLGHVANAWRCGRPRYGVYV